MPIDYTTKDIARFWSKVDISGECWIWTGHTSRGGYGHVKISRKTLKAHRVAWELTNGSIPGDLIVCHHCDNPCCVRPNHLFLGTPKDNVQDCINKGRRNYLLGETRRTAKLRSAQVLEIRHRFANGETNQSALSREFGVSIQAIANIISRHTWHHLD